MKAIVLLFLAFTLSLPNNSQETRLLANRDDSLVRLSVKVAHVLSRTNPFCSVSLLLLDNTSQHQYSPEMVKTFSKSLMPIGFVHPHQGWTREKYFAKMRDSCHYVVVGISENGEVSHFVSAFNHFIQSQDDGESIVVRDRDYFVFFSISFIQAESVLLSDLKDQIRFKVAFVGGDVPQIVTVNQYTPVQMRNIQYGQIVNIASLSPNESIIPQNHIFIDFTWKLNGYPMKMAVLNRILPMYEVADDRNSSGKITSKRGYLANMTETIHAKLNISTTFILCSGAGKYPEGALSGLQLPNSTWIGCMGDLLYKRVDISMATLVPNRYSYVHFLPPYKYGFINYFSRKPNKMVSWTAFYRAFKPLVWTTLALSVIPSVILIWIGISIHTKKSMSLINIFFDHMAIHLGQGVDASFIETGGMTTLGLFALLLFCSLVLGTAYNSKLTALMSIPEIEPNFPTNFESLSTASHFQFGAEKGFIHGAGGVYFKKSTSSTISGIFGKMEHDENLEDCLRRSLTSNYACISYNLFLQFEAGLMFADNRGVIPFFESSDMFSAVPYMYTVRKREILRHSYGYFVENLYEMGLNDKWISVDMMKLRLGRIKNGAKAFNYNVKEGVQPLTIRNFVGSFIILCVGLLLGMVLFLIERCLKYKCLIFKEDV